MRSRSPTGTIRAADLKQIAVEGQPGLATYDQDSSTRPPASAITYIDGEQGILEYRGYPIEQLAEHSTFLEVAYLANTANCRPRPSLTNGCITYRSFTRTSSSSSKASATTRIRWGC